MRNMPMILVDTLQGEAQTFAKAIVANQGKNKGRLRTARSDKFSDEAYYVWRMVSFQVSPAPGASCMPIGAMYTLPRYRANHATTCERSEKFYPSFDVAYTRGVGLYDDKGNYRVACNCGETEKEETERTKENKRQKELDAIVDVIVSTIPREEQYGLRRWNKAFTGSDPYDKGGVFDNVSAYLTPEQEAEGCMM